MLEPLKDNLSLIAILFSLGGTLYAWFTTRSRVNEKQLEKFGEIIRKIDHRVTEIEGEIKHLPDKDSQHQLEISMERMAGDMKQMSEALSATVRTVGRIETHLLQKGGNK